MTHRYRAAIACAVAAVFLVGCSKSPEATVENFYRHVSKGKISVAKGYLSSQVVNMLGDGKLTTALTAQAEKVQACGGIASIDVKLQGEGEVRSGVATVKYSGNCAAVSERVKLVKENGTWKITASK